MCVAALLVIAALIAYECGRYHRSPAAMAEAAAERIRWIFVVTEQSEYCAAEPCHAGGPLSQVRR